MTVKQKKSKFEEKDGIDVLLTFLIWVLSMVALICLLLYFNNRVTRELFDWLNPDIYQIHNSKNNHIR